MFKRVTGDVPRVVSALPNLVFHIEDGLDVFLVELQGRDWPDLVIILLLVVVLPQEGLRGASQANGDYPEHLAGESNPMRARTRSAHFALKRQMGETRTISYIWGLLNSHPGNYIHVLVPLDGQAI